MKKMYVTVLVMMVLVASMMTACGSSSAGTSSGDSGYEEADDSAVTAETSESAGAPTISMDDIDWSVNESVLDGERILSLDYTNNTAYTIVALEIEFVQSEDASGDVSELFSYMQETYDYTEEDLSEIYICGYNSRMADPGETVSGSPCTINGTYILVTDMEQYEIMEPDMASIALIGDDDKLYTIYYDFRSSTFGSSSQGGQDIYTWSDSELVSALPVPELRVVFVSSDEEDYFFAYCYGVSADEYAAYADACKECGFDDVGFESEGYSYRATNEEGCEVTLYYSSTEEEMTIKLEAPEEETDE